MTTSKPNTDLDSLTSDWRAVARYTVVRTQGFASQRSEVITKLHSDQTYTQAVASASIAEEALRHESGHRSGVMSRALIGIRLERPIETRLAYLASRK